MNIIKRLMIALVCALALGCGVSPQEASDELDRLGHNPDEWCGYDDTTPPEVYEVSESYYSYESDDVEKWNHPDGFGVAGNSTGCWYGQTTWGSGWCGVPATKTQRFYLQQGAQDAAWFKNSTDIYGALEARMDSYDWNISRVGSGGSPSITVSTGTTDPSGYLGLATRGTWTLMGHTPRGDYWTSGSCTAKLFRTSIEANQFYQAASSAQKTTYLKNLWQHEMLHCLGFGHRIGDSNMLMSVVYNYPGPYFNTELWLESSEVTMAWNFDPTNW